MSTHSISSAMSLAPVAKHYYVDGYGGWFVVHTVNAKRARSIGVAEYGRGGVRLVRPATVSDVGAYKRAHGDDPNKPLPFED